MGPSAADARCIGLPFVRTRGGGVGSAKRLLLSLTLTFDLDIQTRAIFLGRVAVLRT